MYKAPTGRVKTIDQALAKDLRNLPIIEPSDQMAGALARALDRVATTMRAQADEEPRYCEMRPRRRFHA